MATNAEIQSEVEGQTIPQAFVRTVEACADDVAVRWRNDDDTIDFSTIKVEKCKAFAGKLRGETGVGWIDAPVSGGPPASGAGSLTVMAGGEAAEIERAQAFFADFAGRFTHMGPTGSGMVAKMHRFI